MSFKRAYHLNEIIKENGIENTQHFLQNAFSCELNQDIERFLFKNAIRFEQARIARTYLILDENSQFLAYFTLSFKSVITKTNKSTLKKLTGGLTNSNQINAFLIGQIGKNTAIKNNSIHLADILSEIYSLIENAQADFGGRAVILECENNSKLISHYEKHGFKLLETEDENDLKTMFIIPDF